jgi:hypothetical protein
MPAPNRRGLVVALLGISIACSVASLAAHLVTPVPGWVTPLNIVALLLVIFATSSRVRGSSSRAE